MNFACEHLIKGVDPKAYERLFFDEEFNEGLCQEVGLTRRLIRRDADDEQIVREVECVPQRDIPGPIARVLGAERFSYTEHVDYRWGSFCARWQSMPAQLQNKVSCQGTYLFKPHASGTLRRVEGDVTVRLFGLGGVIERFIIQDIEQSFGRAAAYSCQALHARR